MIPAAHELKSFYRSFGGRIVRRVLAQALAEFWPPAEIGAGEALCGYGYAAPYLRSYMEGRGEGRAPRAILFMPSRLGVHHWPPEGANRAALVEEADWPLETNSLDRLMMVHGFEFAPDPHLLLEEAFRVLKSSGRLLLVVPNRMGLWSHADMTPFALGTPYMAGRIGDYLKAARFAPERQAQALFVPPFRSDLVLRSAGLWEKAGPYIMPSFGGVHVVEAVKQLYAAVPPRGKPQLVKIPGLKAPAAAGRGLGRS